MFAVFVLSVAFVECDLHANQVWQTTGLEIPDHCKQFRATLLRACILRCYIPVSSRPMKWRTVAYYRNYPLKRDEGDDSSREPTVPHFLKSQRSDSKMTFGGHPKVALKVPQK